MSKQWYGSFQNRLMERSVIGQPEPEVGMGATTLHYSDRHACTISEVHYLGNDRYRIGVQRDEAKVIKGSCQDGSAEYQYTPRPEGYVSFFQQDKKGVWKAVRLNEATGRWKNAGTEGLRIGDRDEHYDPSF